MEKAYYWSCTTECLMSSLGTNCRDRTKKAKSLVTLCGPTQFLGKSHLVLRHDLEKLEKPRHTCFLFYDLHEKKDWMYLFQIFFSISCLAFWGLSNNAQNIVNTVCCFVFIYSN